MAPVYTSPLAPVIRHLDHLFYPSIIQQYLLLILTWRQLSLNWDLIPLRHKQLYAASAYVGKIVDTTASAYVRELSVFCHFQVVVSCAMIVSTERAFLVGLQQCLFITIPVSNAFVN